jgi:hypothetical protein
VPGGLQPQGLERERARKRARMMDTMKEWEYSCDKCNWIHKEEEECGE